jgi:hypothetical protein
MIKIKLKHYETMSIIIKIIVDNKIRKKYNNKKQKHL